MNENARLPDLVVNGVSNASGGKYGNVKIDGVGKVHGDVEGETFKVNGVIRINGSVKAEQFECDGKLTIGGPLNAERMRFNGLVDVKGGVAGDLMELNGMLTAKGDCECESVQGEGAFTIAGLLSAGTLNVKLHGRSSAAEIGVEKLVVRPASKSVWSKMWIWLFPKYNPELSAVSIEGDDIDVESTKAQVVRGNRIVVGKGCAIGRVEFKNELIVHPGATVGERVRTGG